MRRQACSLWVVLGLSACFAPASRPAPMAPARMEDPPVAVRSVDSATPVASASAPAPTPPDDLEPCSDPVEAAYLSDCQEGSAIPGDAAADPEEIDDELDDRATDPPRPPGPPAPPPPHPFANLSDRELEQMYEDNPESVGSMSVGTPNAGALVNGVAMPRGDGWVLIDPAHAWGTQETVDALTRALNKVFERFPDSPTVQIGHISARLGGPLSPHVSHQAGRDVDISYYLTIPSRSFVRATEANLDRERTWAFVRALITETDVEMILIDRSIQKMLRDYALSIGEQEAWLNDIFDGRPGVRALIHHVKGHANHIHVRFYNPIAQETARRLQRVLAKRGSLPTPVSYILHRARSGDTLSSLARRYGTTVEAIQAANGLRTTAIKARKVYKIPRPGAAKPVAPSQPSTPPPRRVPPSMRKPSRR